MLTNDAKKPIYTGVTNNIARRIFEHRNKLADGFTKKYNLKKLVYYEIHNDIIGAITREKLIKRWRREIKFEAIENINPQWKDLYTELNN